MTVTVQAIISKELEAVQTTQYTSTAARTILDKFTVTNNDAVARTFSVNLVTDHRHQDGSARRDVPVPRNDRAGTQPWGLHQHHRQRGQRADSAGECADRDLTKWGLCATL
jgi:hypothetical protein